MAGRHRQHARARALPRRLSRFKWDGALEQAEQLQHDDNYNDNSDDIEDVSVHKLRVLAAQPRDGEMFRHRSFPKSGAQAGGASILSFFAPDFLQERDSTGADVVCLVGRLIL